MTSQLLSLAAAVFLLVDRHGIIDSLADPAVAKAVSATTSPCGAWNTRA